MATKIRLARYGSKKRPVYRIVVTDSRNPRDGRFIERVGWHDPRLESGDLKMNLERVDYWLGTGAQTSDTVRSLIKRARREAAAQDA